MPNLIRNAIRTPDGTIIESRSQHDFVTHVDKRTRKEYMIDGGLDYSRRSAHGDEEDLCVYDDAPHDLQRQVLRWGTYGKTGIQPYRMIPIADMETTHILAVLKECNPSLVYKNCMLEELEVRGVAHDDR